MSDSTILKCELRRDYNSLGFSLSFAPKKHSQSRWPEGIPWLTPAYKSGEEIHGGTNARAALNFHAPVNHVLAGTQATFADLQVSLMANGEIAPGVMKLEASNPGSLSLNPRKSEEFLLA